VGGNGLISLAETNIPSGVAALLVATIPMFMVLVEALRPGGIKPTFWQVIGLLIGFSGVVILIGPAEFGGVREFSLLGGATALFAAILWSLGSIYSRSAELPKSTLLLTGMEMLAGSLGLFIVSGLTGEFSAFQIANVSRSSLLGLLYLICFGSLVGFTSYAWLLRNAPISLISTYPYVNPIVAILLGWLFGDGIPGARIFIAALVILGSVVVVSLAGRHTAQPEHMEPDEIV
jgi:drug/metabolite transporter (DMT)-like permease